MHTSPTAQVTVQSCGWIPRPSAAKDAVCRHLRYQLIAVSRSMYQSAAASATRLTDRMVR